MRIIRKENLRNTSRHVESHAYETFRFLLASDGAGVTVTDIVLKPGILETYGSADRTEISYCLEGEAVLTELADNSEHKIVPGTLFVASPGDRFTFLASQPTRCICVFIPPFSGEETGFADHQP